MTYLKYFFYFFFSIQALSLSAAAQDIITHASAKGFENILKNVKPYSWVIVDLDNTVFQSPQALGHVNWLQSELKDLTDIGYSRENAFEELYPLWERTQALSGVIPVEKAFVDLIKKLQDKHITVMALTARQLPIVNDTLGQIKSLGLNFSKTAPTQSRLKIKASAPAYFKNGVLFAGDFNKKSEVFELFLKELGYPARDIVYIDDSVKHVIDIHNMAKEMNLYFSGIHYTAVQTQCDEDRCIYNRALAEIQKSELKNSGQLISNDEAKSIMLSQPQSLYKILSAADWEKYQYQEYIPPTSSDTKFIHLATKGQLGKIANKYWKNKDFVVLKLDSDNLLGNLVHEANPNGTQKYFHLYNGKIPHDAVVSVEHDSEFRAAIDMGSGTIKFKLAKVSKLTNSISSVLKEEITPIDLTENLKSNGNKISSDKFEQIKNALLKIKDDAINIAAGHDVNFACVATAAFRRADNGYDALRIIKDRLGLDFEILEQHAEGELGFATAQALFPEIASDKLLALDSGNGSFQLSTNSHVCEGAIGHGDVRDILQNNKKDFRDHILNQLPKAPTWLKEKAEDEQSHIVTFGDGQSIFALAHDLLGEDVFTYEQIKTLATEYSERDEKYLKNHNLHLKTISSLIHLEALMFRYEINKLYFKRTAGSTLGMLISKELY